MSKRLLQGAAASMVNGSGAVVRRLLLGATWSNTNVDIDVSALLCQRDGTAYKVPDETHFLYRKRQAAPNRTAFVTYLPPGVTAGPDRAQVLLDLGGLDHHIRRVVVAMTAQRPGAYVGEMGQLRTRAMDLDSGETMYVYQHGGPALNHLCMTLWILDRVGTYWEGKVTAAGYMGGPPALVRDYGVRR